MKNLNGLQQIKQMNDAIYHRGPDDEGIYNYDDVVFMGMRRLSIIDLQNGKQPISNENNSITIVFNGEIYNFIELRDKLINLGHEFKTKSDTEVVLKLYEHFGESMVDMLDGMFAFSIHDKNKNLIFLARDRYGEKPLHYSFFEGTFIFSSELKSIIKVIPKLKVIDKSAVEIYFALSYIPAPHTIYEGVKKLLPGHFLIINTETLDCISQSYIKIQQPNQEKYPSYDYACRELKHLVFESIESRMVSDVPLGVFLSGGVDSSIVATVMAELSATKINTFTVGYKDKRYDESSRASIIAKSIKSEHHTYTLDLQDLLSDLKKVILNYDEPYGDPSALPTFFISKKTSDFVKVALTGDGGDEVFGGYNKYLLHSYGAIYQKIIPKLIHKQLIEPLTKLIATKNPDSKSLTTKLYKLFSSIGGDTVYNHLQIIQLAFKNQHIRDLLPQIVGKINVNDKLRSDIKIPEFLDEPLSIARFIDFRFSLEGDLLVKVDRASMLTSLECRAPFLNRKLVEFSYNVPSKYLIRGNDKKRILKDTFADLMPKSFFNSPKSGFEIPIGSWFRNELRSEMLKVLSENNINKHSFFDSKFVSNIINEHLYGHVDHSWKLWSLYCFQIWYDEQF